MNYKPVVAGNQSNSNAGTKACNDADSKSSPDARFKSSGRRKRRMLKIQGIKIVRTNTINTVSLTVNAASIEVNAVDPKSSIELPYDLNMLELEDIFYSDDDEDVGAEANMTNLDTHIPISPIPTTRIHKDHPVKQINGDIHSAPQTRRMTKKVTEHVMFSSEQQRTTIKTFKMVCLHVSYHKQSLRR
ncbi:hypothetical protein Tco_1416607 [Tanacetum coccineum]